MGCNTGAAPRRRRYQASACAMGVWSERQRSEGQTIPSPAGPIGGRAGQGGEGRRERGCLPQKPLRRAGPDSTRLDCAPCRVRCGAVSVPAVGVEGHRGTARLFLPPLDSPALRRQDCGGGRAAAAAIVLLFLRLSLKRRRRRGKAVRREAAGAARMREPPTARPRDR